MKYNYKEIGETLKAKRLELGRDIAAMAADTKVLEKNILAIEEGDLKAFFSPVYYDLFARSYARELGFDPDELFGSQIVEEEPPMNIEGGENKTPENPSVVTLPVSQPRRSRKGLWFVAGLLIVVALVVVLIFKGEVPPETKSEPSLNPESTPLTSIDSIYFSEDSLSTDSLEEESLVDTRLHLKITVKETCWFLIVADGDTVLMDNLEPGTMQDFTAINRFLISAGNPSGAEYKLNDTLLRPLSLAGKPFKELEINQMNKSSFYQIGGSSL